MCVALYAGLDADLLAVIPAFSRHPSLKHLMLGKNFNIKGRYGPRREPAVQMAEKMILMMNVFLLSLPPQGAGWNSAETSSFGARGRVCELDYVTYCARTHTHENPLWHRCTPTHASQICRHTHTSCARTNTHLTPFKFLSSFMWI